MKKFALASVLAIATSTLGAVPAAYAQAPNCSDQLTIKDPAEFNTYQNAIGQDHPGREGRGDRGFLDQVSQYRRQGPVLTTLLPTYQQANDSANMLKTAKRVLDADPTSLRAALVYVYLTKQQATAKAATDPAGPSRCSMMPRKSPMPR